MCAPDLRITISAPPLDADGDPDATVSYERTLRVPPNLAADHNKLALYLAQTNRHAPVLAAITGDASTMLRLHLTYMTGGDAPPVRIDGLAPVASRARDGEASEFHDYTRVVDHDTLPPLRASVVEHVAGGIDMLPMSGEFFEAPTEAAPAVTVRVGNLTTALCATPVWGERHAACDAWDMLDVPPLKGRLKVRRRLASSRRTSPPGGAYARAITERRGSTARLLVSLFSESAAGAHGRHDARPLRPLLRGV